mgnify:CR=1 FL=1
MTDESHDLLKADAERGWTLYRESPSHHKVRDQCQLLGRLSMGVGDLIAEVLELRRGLAWLETMMGANSIDAGDAGEGGYFVYDVAGTGHKTYSSLIDLVRKFGKATP